MYKCCLCLIIFFSSLSEEKVLKLYCQKSLLRCLGENREMEGVEGAGSSQDFGGKVPGGKENLWWSFRR